MGFETPSDKEKENQPQAIKPDWREPSNENHEILEEIDFDALKSIFSEMTHRSGHQERDAQFLSQQDIKQMNRLEEIGAMLAQIGAYYDYNQNKVLFSGAQLSLDSFINKLTAGKEIKSRIMLSLICHEEAHAISREPHKFVQNDPSTHTESSGFAKYKLVEKKGKVVGDEIYYHIFNEGVTDKIGEEAYNEYVRRTGKRGDVPNLKDPFIASYREGRELVDVFMQALSEWSGVDRATVWNAMKQGYIDGANLGASELQAFFEEALGGSDTLPALRESDTRGTTEALLIKLKTALLLSPPETLRQQALRYLNRLV